MATMAQFVPTEVPLDFDVPQREAAFFYGLFLRGHSAEQLRRDIEVPPAVLAKWHREALSGIAKQSASRSYAISSPAWSNTAATSSLSSTLSLAGTASSSASNKLHPNFVGRSPQKTCTNEQAKNCQATLF